MTTVGADDDWAGLAVDIGDGVISRALRTLTCRRLS